MIKKKQLINKQVFKISELQREQKKLTVQVEIEMYNRELKLEGKYSTLYQCIPSQSDVLVNVFPFTDLEEKKVAVDVSSSDFKSLYLIEKGTSLKDIYIKMSIESGALSFLGSKNLISYTSRKKTADRGFLKLTGHITIEAYLLGIKLKTLHYEATEHLSRDGQLLNQTFKEPNGSYFEMRYTNKRRDE
ncbi:hypothetical protein GCM10023188_15180 [Pontibacter saemangeumensis]|uniref:Uncharacterized protein n=1 Tax=Pontibacter saemangeumensis TaxID=1084525 RepID=A0ABP8LJQ7_9BACT